jgi:hypothetical protein
VGPSTSLACPSVIGRLPGSGAFLDIAFWDLPYYLYAAIAGTKYVALNMHTEGAPLVPTLARGAIVPSGEQA